MKFRTQRANIIDITVFRYVTPFNIPTFFKELTSTFFRKKTPPFFCTGSPDSYRKLGTAASKYLFYPEDGGSRYFRNVSNPIIISPGRFSSFFYYKISDDLFLLNVVNNLLYGITSQNSRRSVCERGATWPPHKAIHARVESKQYHTTHSVSISRRDYLPYC
jgi:hypothetical protein